MFTRILFVCTGNICRSAMAEALLRSKAIAGIEVASAGTAAMLGHPAEEHVRELLTTRSIDVDDHRARQLTRETLRWADLVLAMERHHLQEIYDIDTTARGKSFLVGHWLAQHEIIDPYQQGREAFKRTLTELDESLATWPTHF